MKRRLLAISLLGSLLLSLLFSTLLSVNISQSNNSVLSETRRSALIDAIAKMQLKGIGAFRFYTDLYMQGYFIESGYLNERITADALQSLYVLGGLSNVDVEEATSYLASKQHPRSGGYILALGYDGTILGFDLYPTWRVVRVLRLLGDLDQLNMTMLRAFVLERYDEVTGGFHELTTQVYGRNYSLTSFPMIYPGGLRDDAYAIPTMISTFLGVSILAEIGALDLINATKTFEWIMSNQASNGMFKPYPAPTYEIWPGWSPFRTNPFPVDSDGTGIPYTYAAVGALNALGRMSVLTQEAREEIADYILSCFEGVVNFRIHKDWTYSSELFNTEYAFETLNIIGMLDEASGPISNATNFLLQQQSLEFDNAWPIPNPTGIPQGAYALQRGEPDNIHRDLSIINATNGISLFDQPTPRAIAARSNLTTLSALVYVAAVATALGITTIAALTGSRLTVKAKKNQLTAQ